MNYVGAVAGATLGFILGDVPGAVIGGEFGYQAGLGQNNLPSMATKRKASKKTVSPRRRKKARTRAKKLLRTKKSKYMKKYSRKGTKQIGHVLQDLSLIKFQMPGRSPKKHSFAGRIKFTDSYHQILTGDLGFQGVFTGRYFHHRNQLIIDSTDAAAKNDRSLTATNVFNLNPNRTTTGSGELPSSTAPQSETIYCSYQKTMMTLTNLTNIPCHVEIYWLLANVDGADEPNVVWQNDLANLGLTQAAQVQPVTTAGTPTAGYPTVSTYGEDPLSNVSFKRYWKLVHKKEFVLPMGMTVRFEFVRPVHKMIKRPDVPVNNMMKGLTFVPMFIFKPAPLVTRLTAEATSTQAINTGPCRIGYMQWDTGYYHVQKDKTTPINRAFISNLGQTVGASTMEVMEPDGDLVTFKQADMTVTLGSNPT